MKPNKKYTYVLLAALSLASCEKTVEKDPTAFISPAVALGQLGTIQSLVTSAYDRMQDFGWYGNNIVLAGDVLADNVYTNPNIPAGGNRLVSVNQNVAGQGYTHWGIAYNAINDVNLVIANIDAAAGDAAAKSQTKGEAYGIRALAFFDLARAYSYEPGKIPTTGTGAGFNKGVVLRTKPTTDATTAGPQVRATVEETYAQIESDFKQAIALLPATTASTSKFMMNKAAAYAMLGRVYLYWGKYADAVTNFDLAINTGFATLAPAGGYAAQFNKPTPTSESFMELAFNGNTEITGVVGSNSTLYSFTNPTNRNGVTFGAQTVSDELVALFEDSDDRKALIYQYGASAATNATGAKFNWTSKYSGGVVSPYVDNIKILRYADVLLMKAEALAMQGQYAPAAALVVTLRTNRNASVAGVPTDASIIPYILTERRRELFYEGQRFFDLKRRGMDITKPAKIAGGTVPYTDRRILMPIPNGEVNNVPGLPQNPGY
jgi:tetratricopeptide (TPR) repeat protein